MCLILFQQWSEPKEDNVPIPEEPPAMQAAMMSPAVRLSSSPRSSPRPPGQGRQVVTRVLLVQVVTRVLRVHIPIGLKVTSRLQVVQVVTRVLRAQVIQLQVNFVQVCHVGLLIGLFSLRKLFLVRLGRRSAAAGPFDGCPTTFGGCPTTKGGSY
ncbi:hypothetical protein DPMN_040165 [Dreissena polymorpha]|uniref:Uncharacterized protein n=1 Tax=Dreissena polymorpha TaxID=45954 RepID=A0A9D4CXA4_DREPO|nr:hypothetical protein DPMN_040165 [Dreissena polymorpha]